VRTLIRVASWLVPAAGRQPWRERWTARAGDWRLLRDRGEPVGRVAPLLRLAFRDAAAERFAPIHLRPLLRAPWFVPLAIAVGLLLLAGVSRGFTVTRWVLSVVHDLRAHPAYCGVYDIRGDKVFAYAAPTVLAWAVGIALLVIGRRALNGSGWRYHSFLALKAAATLALSTLVWIEVGALLRAPIHHEGWRMLAGLLSMFVFIGGTGRTMVWAVQDQRQRCPECLRRLVGPIPVGSWASLFEPAATELLCENGHGALAIADAETNAQDRWTRLDESWQTLFR
jgi:hypothetical protein